MLTILHSFKLSINRLSLLEDGKTKKKKKTKKEFVPITYRG